MAALVAGALLLPLQAGAARAAVVLDAPELTGSPDSPSTVSQPVFTFSSDESTVCQFGLVDGPLPAAQPCTSPYAPEATSDGTWLLTVQAVNGDDTSPVTSRTYVRDASAAATVTEPVSPSADRTPTWGVDVAPGGVATCAVDDGPSQPCAVDHTAAALDDGSYTLTVRVTGVQGATKVITSSAYVLDATGPDAALVTGMPATGSSTTGTWLFGADAGDTAVCELLHVGALIRTEQACTSPASFLLAGQGAWSLRVTLTDAVGNEGEPGTSPDYLLDTAAPPAPVFVSGPPTPSSSRSLTYLLDRAALDPTDVVECQALRGATTLTGWTATVDTGASATCALVLAPAVLDGPVQVVARSVDAVGNASAAVAGPDYVLDGSGPTTTVEGPTGAGTQTTPTWTFVPEVGATTTCRLDEVDGAPGATLDCSAGTLTVGPLADGRYRLTVVQTDAQANAGDPTVLDYEVDTTAPGAPTVTGPLGVTNSTSATWSWPTAPGDTSRCRLLDGGVAQAERPCAGGTTTVVLPGEGAWQLQVLLADGLGNTGDWASAGSSPVLVLDTTAPGVPGVTVQSPVASDLTPLWTVTPALDAQTTTCRVYDDAGTPLALATSCSGSVTFDLGAYGDGTYRLVVVSADLPGNTSQATSDYLLDTTAPLAPTVTGPTGTGNVARSTWNIIGETGSTLTCRLLHNGLAGVAAPCTSPFTVDLPSEGPWVLEVQQTDSAGLTGPWQASDVYLLDTVAPAAPTVTGPTGPSQLLTPSFVLSGPGGALTCAVLRDGALLRAFAPCTTPFVLPLTNADVDGSYVVQAAVTDLAGNTSPVGASAPYVLDRLAPATPSVQGPSGPSSVQGAAWTWTPEAGSTSFCFLSRDGVTLAPAAVCTPGTLVPLTAGDGSYALTVAVRDVAGNLSTPVTSGDYLLDTTAPDAPAVTATPALGSGRAPLLSAVLAADTVSTTCRLTRPDGPEPGFTACSLPRTVDLTGLPQGSYTLEVRALDAAGNASGPGAATYVLDDVAPPLPVLRVLGAAGTPDAPTGPDASPTLSFTTEVDVIATCRVVGLPATTTTCSGTGQTAGTYTPDLTAQPDGSYVLEVSLRDAAGNTSTETLAYVLDRTPPAPAAFSEQPGRYSSAPVWTWSWTTEPEASTSCSLTGPGGAVALTGPCLTGTALSTVGLAEGSWLFQLTITDLAGNSSVTTTTQVLDRRAPSLTVIAPAPTSGASPTWLITTDGDLTTVRCTLVRPGGGTEAVPCTTSYSLPDQGAAPVQGRYVLQVSVLSNALVAASADSAYDLDTVAPALTVDVGPTPSNDARPQWTTTASPDATTLVSCRLVGPLALTGPVPAGSADRPCGWSRSAITEVDGSPLDFSGPGTDGRYLVLAVVGDRAGNTSPLPTEEAPSGTWVRDTVVAGVGTTLTTPGNDRAPFWDFTGVEAGAALNCVLLGVDHVSRPVPCGPSGYRGALLQDGDYVLTVVQTDPAGNASDAVNLPYTLDTVLPALTLTFDGPDTSAASSTAFRFASPDRTAAFTCTLTTSSGVDRSGPCASPYALDATVLTVDGAYTLAVVATDPAGNDSVTRQLTYTLDRDAPAPPVVGSALPGIGRDRNGLWTLRTDGSEETTRCWLQTTAGVVLRGPDPCSPATGYAQDLEAPGLGQRDYIVRAVSTDRAGNASASGYSRPYRYDRTAQAGYSKVRFPGDHPEYREGSVPPTAKQGYTNQQSAAWRFRTAVGATVTCSLSRVQADRSLVAVVPTGRCATLVGDVWTFAYALPRIGSASGQATYRFSFRVEVAGDPAIDVTDDVVYDWRIDRPLFVDGNKTGNQGTTKWTFAPPSTDLNAVAVCTLAQVVDGAVQPPLRPSALCDAGNTQLEVLPFPGVWRLLVAYYDFAGNRSWDARTYTWDRAALAEPVISLSPAVRGTVGQHKALTWTFRVDGGITARCTLNKGAVTLAPPRDCSAGSYGFSLLDQTPGTYTLKVQLSQLNRGDSLGERSYQLLPRVQVVGPPGPPSPGPTSFPQPTQGPGPSQPSPGPTSNPTMTPVLNELPSKAPPAGAPTGGTTTGGGLQASDDDPSVSDLPGRVGDGLTRVVTGVVDRPALPLALLFVVVIFLLVQNRIDRRDPKLAAAPVESEPELGFGPTYRPPPAGGAAPA